MILHIGLTRFSRGLSLNKVLIVEEHPMFVVERIIASHGADLTFTYSRYQIAPPGFQAKAPRSDVLQVNAIDLTPDWLVQRFAELGPNEELAWHSSVEWQGDAFHIPMIDLLDSPPGPNLRQLSQTLAAEMNLRGDFIFFNTGQSFHAYFPDLIAERAWHQYLGRLLVFNKQDWPQIIDTRWVGHALGRGFSALRWSNNTNRYRAMPRLCRVFGSAAS